MTVFDNIKCPNWGLFSGTALLTAYEGKDQVEARDLLEQCVDAFCARSAGRYTLVIYRGLKLKDGELINNKTPYTNSINFRLNHDQRSAVGDVVYNERYGDRDTSKAMQALYAENARLKVEVEKAKLIQPAAAEETWADKVGGVIDAFGVADIMPDLARGILNKFLPGIAMPAKLSGATTAEGQQQAPPAADLQAAIDILNAAVPDLPFILSKFAALAQQRPEQFQFYANAIRNM